MGLDNLRMLRKVVAIYKTYKPILSKNISEKSTLKKIKIWKNYHTQKVAAPNFIFKPTNYIFLKLHILIFMVSL